ncbi:hypothetical protein H5410_027964 [Solanum commersonii]|uniref:Uncharacterized protein n=1 Tax=Solanum commersonii TaxID=4109 RepID=A0A9J5Z3F3_SOLCO|nr:hypothetical protein H5410_027964 [Solanum commersonii]
MTPTLKEIVSFMWKGSSVRSAELRNKKLIIPKNVDAKKFLELLKINQIENEGHAYRHLSDWGGEGVDYNGKSYYYSYDPGRYVPCIDLMYKWGNLSEMVVEQDKGRVVSGYLLWFRDLVTFGDIPKGSNRKRKDQHIIRQLEKDLEKAKDTIVRQEVQVQRGRNHQLELQDVEGELKHTGGKFGRLKEELDSRIHLARQIKKE